MHPAGADIVNDIFDILFGGLLFYEML